MNQKVVNAVGYFAMFMGFAMFGSYVDQIRLNWIGKIGSIWIPIATVVNCLAWTIYALFKTERDWKIALPNIVGVVLGGFTAWTAVYCVSRCSF